MDSDGSAALTGKGMTAYTEFRHQYPQAHAVEVILQNEIGKFFRIQMTTADWLGFIVDHKDNNG